LIFLSDSANYSHRPEVGPGLAFRMHSATSFVNVDSTSALASLLRCALLLVCGLSLTGCSSVIHDTHHVFFLARRTTKLEPRHFPYIKNEKQTRRRDAALARRAWTEVVAQSGGGGFSKHYERGFLTGFADYMFRGGDGQVPLVPPRDYWQLGYQSERGKQAVDDWYAGFRHGTEECRARGYREMVVVRSSLLSGYEMPHSEVPLPHDTHTPAPVPAEALPVPEPATAEPTPAEPPAEADVISPQGDASAWSPLRPAAAAAAQTQPRIKTQTHRQTQTQTQAKLSPRVARQLRRLERIR
jgi:hypothetical protein